MLRRVLPHGLIIVAVAMMLLLFRQWAYVTTYRLYLDHRVDDAARSTATQRFDLAGSRVVPRIVTDDDRVSFRADTGRDATIRVDVQPEGSASYEIHLRQDGVDRVAARGELTAPTSLVCPFPTGTGVIDIVSHGRITWSDLRVQRNLRVIPELPVLGLVLAWPLVWMCVARARRTSVSTLAWSVQGLRPWLAALTVFLSVAMTTLAAEAGLRVFGSRLSSGISTARHDLGELTQDPRWQQTSRYGSRLNANVDVMNQWRDGDIVRMGFIPPAASDGRVRRFPFHTDAEGFRNAAVRDHIEVAALGDSFTDALTLPAEAAWTTRLEQRLGRPVQNYGTAGFGPQQELLVLQDYAARHHPRVVVLAFFAGNDIHDAEAFERFQRGAADAPRLGWPIKDVFTRADTWFTMNAWQSAVAAVSQPPNLDQAPALTAMSSPPPLVRPGFDRGMFAVPVNGHVLQWSLMPPYLNLLNFSEQEIAERRGWALVLQSLAAMQRTSRSIGAEFVLMFIPFKSQVYLPLLERTFSRADLAKALHFFLRDRSMPPDVEQMSRNRLAQNLLLKRFCEAANIPLLDMTPALQARVEAGENMYFPDDSHLNEAGDAVVAASLADFLQELGLASSP